ncbi:MAG: HAD-IA family hydrolase [Nitrospirales bacterium]
MIGGIVFDFDGTLVDSNDIKLQTFYEVTKSHDPTGTIIAHILKQSPNKDRYEIFQAFVQELFTKDGTVLPDNSAAFATQWAQDYTVTCEKAIAACDEVLGTSETFKWIFGQHIPIFINSRTPTATLKRLVTLRSLHSYITEVYGAPASKAENLRHIQNQTQAKSKDILFVGDSEDDREAALEVGCHFVGVVLRGKSRFPSPPPDSCIPNLFHLQQIVTVLHAKNPKVITPIEEFLEPS